MEGETLSWGERVCNGGGESIIGSLPDKIPPPGGSVPVSILRGGGESVPVQILRGKTFKGGGPIIPHRH